MRVVQLQTRYRQSNLGITVKATEPLHLSLMECSFISRWRVCTSRMPRQLTYQAPSCLISFTFGGPFFNFNSVLSNLNAKFTTIVFIDFYLKTPMDH
jgi:hypothetical protein